MIPREAARACITKISNFIQFYNMEILKLTSIRLSKSVLAQANKIGRALGYYSTSNVLRVAIWVGLKFIKPGVLHLFLQMMWQEECKGVHYTIDDVIRTAREKL